MAESTLLSADNTADRLKTLRELGVSRRMLSVCSMLTGDGARNGVEAAEELGVTPEAVYMMRLRLERKLGVRLPRPPRRNRRLTPAA